jgi:hypothetical protein
MGEHSLGLRKIVLMAEKSSEIGKWPEIPEFLWPPGAAARG